MAARPQPPNSTIQAHPQYSASNLSLLEGSRAGDSFTVYADYAVWDSTLNTFVDPGKIQHKATGRIGFGAFAGNY